MPASVAVQTAKRRFNKCRCQKGSDSTKTAAAIQQHRHLWQFKKVGVGSKAAIQQRRRRRCKKPAFAAKQGYKKAIARGNSKKPALPERQRFNKAALPERQRFNKAGVSGQPTKPRVTAASNAACSTLLHWQRVEISATDVAAVRRVAVGFASSGCVTRVISSFYYAFASSLRYCCKRREETRVITLVEAKDKKK